MFICGSAERHNFHFPYVELNAAIAQLAVEGRRVEAAAEMRAYLQRARADVRELLARA